MEDFYQSKDIASQADNDTLYNCAFNFPAMLMLYGKEAWKDLKQCYLKMSTDKFYKVRKSLACSINEVAALLGKEETENVLIPIFERFYREEGEIQKSIYKSMPKFLLNVQPDKRKSYLERFKRLLRTKEKWRTKKEYVEILGNLGGVFDDDLTYEQIFPVCLHMCFDEVAEVRIHAAKSIKSLILHFLGLPKYKEKIKDILKAFAYSLKYIYRMLFIYLCKEMVTDPQIINDYFIDHIEVLSRDKIANIQHLLATLLIDMLNTKLYDQSIELRRILARSLSNTSRLILDEYQNVQTNEIIRSISSEELEDARQLQFSNPLFTNRMEAFKEFNIPMAVIPSNSKNKFDPAQKSQNDKIKDFAEPGVTQVSQETSDSERMELVIEVEKEDDKNI